MNQLVAWLIPLLTFQVSLHTNVCLDFLLVGWSLKCELSQGKD